MKKRLGKKTFDKESQQLHSVRHDHRRSVPLPMACGTLLQMDQAASSDKAFYGTTENAVKTRAWIAVSVYVFVTIVRKLLKLDQSLYTILQILSVTLFERTPILQVFSRAEYDKPDSDTANQLSLYD